MPQILGQPQCRLPKLSPSLKSPYICDGGVTLNCCASCRHLRQCPCCHWTHCRATNLQRSHVSRRLSSLVGYPLLIPQNRLSIVAPPLVLPSPATLSQVQSFREKR